MIMAGVAGQLFHLKKPTAGGCASGRHQLALLLPASMLGVAGDRGLAVPSPDLKILSENRKGALWCPFNSQPLAVAGQL